MGRMRWVQTRFLSKKIFKAEGQRDGEVKAGVLVGGNQADPRGTGLKKHLREANKPDSVTPLARSRCPFLWTRLHRRVRAAYPKAVAARAARWLSYLALHRIRHSWQALSPKLRWSLTPPFHPCLAPKTLRSLNGIVKRSGARRFVSVELALHLCSFPLGSIPPCGVRTFLRPFRDGGHLVFP